MIYICFAMLLLGFFVYMNLAKKFNIVDRPNSRSSHKEPTIRGGGLVFFLACLLFFLFYGYQYPYYFVGLTLIATISFLDDLYSLSARLRFPLQFTAIILTMVEIQLFTNPLYMSIPILIFSVGFLNIYNFMDGINGITGIYSLAIFLSILYVNNYYLIDFVDNHLIFLLLVSLGIFGFFNFRKKAAVFAGDIGSITLGLTIILLLGKLVQETQSLLFVLFGALYIVDGGLTLLERLFILKENIFKPHRRHLYQVMVDSGKFSHLGTSALYGILQLVICGLAVLANKVLSGNLQLLFFFLSLVLLSIPYIMIKRTLISRKSNVLKA